ncbi:RHS repeat-associated core domain-containing protein, partial [Clostridium sp. HMP27]|uniref:RHS repeat-associated core domain-containing protein n=1 Tax=Clostridium sp. HMP27 TaxID=1487921 RepID=UPI00052DD4F2
NPYRYRGYRYDDKTGLYYLNSRYYNPEMGRFINMDSIGGKVGDLLSHNAFIYCQNNPVMNSDTSGQWFETFLDVVSVVSSLVSFIKSPSWKAATVLAYDCAAAVAPVVPASGTLKALQRQRML